MDRERGSTSDVTGIILLSVSTLFWPDIVWLKQLYDFHATSFHVKNEDLLAWLFEKNGELAWMNELNELTT